MGAEFISWHHPFIESDEKYCIIGARSMPANRELSIRAQSVFPVATPQDYKLARGEAGIAISLSSSFLGFYHGSHRRYCVRRYFSIEMARITDHDFSLGPGLIGVILNALLHGVMGLQCCHYYNYTAISCK